MSDETERDRARSISEYVPDAMAVPKPRHIAVSGTHAVEPAHSSAVMHREEYLGTQRGLVTPVAQPPVAPSPSNEPMISHEDEPPSKRAKLVTYTAMSVSTGQPKRYEVLKQLGQGTFSKVYLAVRRVEHQRQDSVDYRKESINMAGVKARSRRLVAVKVVEHGPAGGADADRIEVSLKRELELLKVVQHPSIVHLKAFGTDEESRALLVVNYCPGGDLFEVASSKLDVLTPPLVRRIFAELVSAVRYLHQKFIVHRDIKLESKLTQSVAEAPS